MKNNINKEKAYKIIAMVLSVVMVLGSLLWIAEKGSSAAESNAEDTTETQEAIEKEYPDLLAGRRGQQRGSHLCSHGRRWEYTGYLGHRMAS